MALERARFRATEGAWRAWVHLIALALIAGVLDTTLALSDGSVATIGGALGRLPDLYFGVLPVLTAISAGMLSFGPRSTRQATVMVLAVTAVMLLLDPLGSRSVVGAPSMAVIGQGLQSSTVGDFTGAPLLGTVLRALHGELPLPLPRATRYEGGAPLLMVVFAILKAAHLLLPAALVGMVLGVQAWMADHVVFRRPVDERVASIVLAWLFTPAAFYLDLRWARRLAGEVLFHGATPGVPLLPTAVLLVIGAVGWATARRVAHWST